MKALSLSLIRWTRTGMIRLRKAKRCSSEFLGLTYFWKSMNWKMKARQKGRKGKRKQKWCGCGDSSVQDQEKTAIIEVMMRKPM